MPGCHFYFDYDLNRLVEQQSALLQPGDLFGPSPMIIVQNESLENWLKFHLTDRYGVSCGITFFSASDAIRKIIIASPFLKSSIKGKSLLLKGDFNLIIYRCLMELFDPDRSPPEELQFLLAYLDGITDRALLSEKIYELSAILSELFSRYILEASVIIQAWQSGGFLLSADHPLYSHERWQRYLWDLLFYHTRSITLLDVIELMRNRGMSAEGMPPRIVIFGSYFLNPMTYDFFQVLSRYVEVHMMIVSPIDPAATAAHQGLTSTFGAYGRSHLDYIKAHSTGPLGLLPIPPDALLTGLGPLTKAMLANDATTTLPPDRIQVHSVPGKLRAVEILYDILLDLLERHPDLTFSDIAVMAPDINQYAPYVEAVFSTANPEHKMPFSMIDLQTPFDSHYLHAFWGLLELAGSRFTRKEIFTLINNPCIAARHGISADDQVQWLALCDQLQIKWGVHAEHLRALDMQPVSHTTWTDGLNRVLLGFAMSNPDLSRCFSHGMEIIPFDHLFDCTPDSIGKLISLIHRLYDLTFDLTRRRETLQNWVQLARGLQESLISVRPDVLLDRESRQMLNKAFDNMLSAILNITDIADKTFDFGTFKAVLKDNLSTLTTSSGHFGGITFSSIKPLRAVPFKVIALLGMDEDIFPRRDTPFAFDLTQTLGGMIQDSPRQIDRYAFLEILLSARDHLIMLYTGRNDVTGDPMQPSALINQLLDFLQTPSTVTRWEHPLQNFDKKYFEANASLFSYNGNNLQASIAYYQPNRSAPHGQRGALTKPLGLSPVISLRDVLQFLRNPVKVFFNKTLGIYLHEEENLIEDYHEAFQLGNLEKVLYARDLLTDPDPIAPEDYLKHLVLQGKIAKGIFTYFDRDQLGRIHHNLQTALARIKSHFGLSGIPVSYTLQETLAAPKGEGLPAIRIGDILLSGSIAQHQDPGVFIGYINSDRPRLKDQLPAFISLLAILASPALQDRYEALIVALINPEGEVFVRTMTRPQALGLLEPMIAYYQRNLTQVIPAYPEVCEYIHDHLDAPDLMEILAEWYAGQIAGSQDYHPLRDCPYRQAAYPDLPDFTLAVDLTRQVYSVLLRDPMVRL